MPAIRTLILTLTLALTALTSACATSAAGARGGADGWDAPRWETAVVDVDFNGCVDRCNPLQEAKERLQAQAGGAIEIKDVRTVSGGYIIEYRLLP